MHTRTRLALGLVLAAAACFAVASVANERIAADTRKDCTACHDKPGSKRLTDAGKYFETQKTLDGFDAIQTSFGHCTACHDTKPGSTKLTAKGTQFSAFAKDMPALTEWMKANHPSPAK